MGEQQDNETLFGIAGTVLPLLQVTVLAAIVMQRILIFRYVGRVILSQSARKH